MSSDREGQASLFAAPYDVLHFSIQDTGIGIAPEELDAVLDPFVQTASGRASGEGTGLGVPISHQFVRLMGGRLTMRSELGRGTVFEFDVPVERVKGGEVQVEPPRRRVTGLQPGQRAADGGPYRLLVVDDREASRRLLVKLLSSLVPQEFAIQEAANGREAVDRWERWRPHLIWMDMRMPVMDGYEATRQIKATEAGRETVIIALTASVFEQERSAVLAAGCNDFLRKPFRAAEIFDVLARHLGVKFVYEDLPGEAETTCAGEALDLGVMPGEWLADLRQATIEGDLDWMVTLIEVAQERDPARVAALAELAHNFRHDEILTQIERVTPAVRTEGPP
jgi:CheY-like chemotaxis protein